MLLKYAIAWLPMVILAMLNGAARDRLYGSLIPELRAHQLSCVTAILLFGLYTLLLEDIWPLSSSNEALWIGLVWVAQTMLFEFGMVLFIQRNSLDNVLADYNLLAGRLWVLVLIAMGLLPWAVFSF